MHRVGIVALTLTPFVAFSASGKSDSIAFVLAPFLAQARSARSAPAPILAISLFAPQQKETPVHVVGFQNDRSDVQFVLLNESDKSVIGVALGFVYIAPLGCTPQPRAPDRTEDGYSAGGFPVRIAPHGQAVTTGVGAPVIGAATPRTALFHYPKMIVHVAQSAAAASIQSQVGVIGVWFEDGSTWPAHWPQSTPPNNQDLFFDRSLVEAEAGKCANVGAAENAIQSVKRVVFERESPQAIEQDGDKSTPPHLRFRCSLEGPTAICRMPLETDHTAPQPATEQK